MKKELADRLIRFLKSLEVSDLEEPMNQQILIDLLIALKTGTSVESWLEDIRDNPDDYPYLSYEVESFLLKF